MDDIEIMIFNGKDYAIYAVAAFSMILLFSLQYFICTRTDHPIIRAIPFVYPFLLLALAVICYASICWMFLQSKKYSKDRAANPIFGSGRATCDGKSGPSDQSPGQF